MSRYLPRGRTSPDKLQSWLAFLRNHRDAMVGMDFFTVPTVTFRLLWIFVVLHHERRRILHFGVTDRPEAPWIIQQLREAFPEASPYRYVTLDRDSKLDADVMAFLQATGLGPKRTSVEAPWQNPYAERFGGTLRRELFDKIIVFNEKQLHRLVHEFVTYYQEDRCHLGHRIIFDPSKVPVMTLHIVPPASFLEQLHDHTHKHLGPKFLILTRTRPYIAHAYGDDSVASLAKAGIRKPDDAVYGVNLRRLLEDTQGIQPSLGIVDLAFGDK